MRLQLNNDQKTVNIDEILKIYMTDEEYQSDILKTSKESSYQFIETQKDEKSISDLEIDPRIPTAEIFKNYQRKKNIGLGFLLPGIFFMATPPTIALCALPLLSLGYGGLVIMLGILYLAAILAPVLMIPGLVFIIAGGVNLSKSLKFKQEYERRTLQELSRMPTQKIEIGLAVFPLF
jgi:TusA-related sulfurtransferase